MTNNQTQINFEEIEQKVSELKSNANKERALQVKLNKIAKEAKNAKQTYERYLQEANKIYLKLEALRTNKNAQD